MKPDPLAALVHRLVEIEPDESPLISCFLDLQRKHSEWMSDLNYPSSLVAKRLTGRRRTDFEDALGEIRSYLEKSLDPHSKSVAFYARWGENPFFTATEFQVPLKPLFVADTLPHIYPLIELKDSYHRFVIVITTEEEARILETTIGAVTEQILAKRPELRQRVGREWTRDHYRNHKREREQQFIHEKIRILEDLMNRKGHNHLIVAGSPKMVGRLAEALPTRLRKKLITSMAANPSSGIGPILLESIHQFTLAESGESHDRVDMLEASVMTGGLAVSGLEASLDAMRDGYADMLIIDQDFEDAETREELIRLALKTNTQIETVSGSEPLKRLAGVGCLLRYRPGELVSGR